jgi:hypothetical protein
MVVDEGYADVSRNPSPRTGRQHAVGQAVDRALLGRACDVPIVEEGESMLS